MNTKKYTINFLTETKCINCIDKNFCKLRHYYKIIENPTIADIEKLSNCLFYKKTTSKKELFYDSSRI